MNLFPLKTSAVFISPKTFICEQTRKYTYSILFPNALQHADEMNYFYTVNRRSQIIVVSGFSN